jgi:hypothetical protein
MRLTRPPQQWDRCSASPGVTAIHGAAWIGSASGMQMAAGCVSR